MLQLWGWGENVMKCTVSPSGDLDLISHQVIMNF